MNKTKKCNIVPISIGIMVALIVATFLYKGVIRIESFTKIFELIACVSILLFVFFMKVIIFSTNTNKNEKTKYWYQNASSTILTVFLSSIFSLVGITVIKEYGILFSSISTGIILGTYLTMLLFLWNWGRDILK